MYKDGRIIAVGFCKVVVVQLDDAEDTWIDGVYAWFGWDLGIFVNLFLEIWVRCGIFVTFRA